MADWFRPALLLAFAALIWSMRGAPLGVPVSDDYSFLARRFFQRLDPFDSMGGAFYWRPVGRQLYFGVLGGMLLQHPWIVPVLHATALLAMAVLLHRIARRGLPAPAAAAVAVIPILSESARTLTGWASGGQHLFASLFVVAAIHEARFGRLVTASIAALAGVLSHESVALVLPILPLATVYGRHGRRAGIRVALGAAAVAAVWGIGYAVSLAHGVVTPLAAGAIAWRRAPDAWGRVIRATLDLSDLGHVVGPTLVFMQAVVFVTGVALLASRSARARVRRAGPILLAGVALFLVAGAPLAMLSDWNDWRAWLPSLALGTTYATALGLAWTPLAVAFVALRLVALLFQPVAAAKVSWEPPPSVSQMSFPRLVRLQRVVDSSRRALARENPTLPRDAIVCYTHMPQLCEVGFQGSAALRVWYRDSTLSFRGFGGNVGYLIGSAAMLDYVPETAAPAVLIGPDVLALEQRARELMRSGRYAAADSVLAIVLARLPHAETPYSSTIIQNRSRAEFNLGNYAAAESLNQVCLGIFPDADSWEMAARIALIRKDANRAAYAIGRCLEIDPGNRAALEMKRSIRLAR